MAAAERPVMLAEVSDATSSVVSALAWAALTAAT